MRRLEALDGLRAVAVFLVIGFHAGVPGLQSGWMGVDVFFVLSGYLITTILLVEWDRTGRIDLPGFYLRRLARLYPALVIMVLVCAPLTAWLGTAWVAPALRALTYTQDFFVSVQDGATGFFGHTWSLAIEEQFYLLWPAALILGGRRRALWVALTGVVVSVGLMLTTFQQIITSPQWPVAYFLPQTRAWQLLAGCVLASWLHRGGRLPRGLSWWGAVGLAGVGAATDVAGPGPLMRWELLAAGGSAVLLVGGLVTAPGLPGRLLALPPLRFVGRISYGVYLFHLPAIVFLHRVLPGSLWLASGIAVAITLTLATLSFYGVERRVQAQARTWWAGRHPARQPAVGAPVAIPSPPPANRTGHS